MRLYQVSHENTAESPLSMVKHAASAPPVDREPEIDFLLEHLEEAVVGQEQSVTPTREEGIGVAETEFF